MGALSSLNLASNSIGGYYTARYPGQPLVDQTFTATPGGSYILLIPAHTYDCCISKFVGTAAIANAIKDMVARTSLNLANNSIGYGGNMDGIKAISSAVKVLAVILVPF